MGSRIDSACTLVGALVAGTQSSRVVETPVTGLAFSHTTLKKGLFFLWGLFWRLRSC